jgi:hypothetical protein
VETTALGIEVGSHVDVGCQQQLDDVPLRQVEVEEGHVTLESEPLDQRDQLVSIPLAVPPDELGVRLARDQVEHRRVLLPDGRHRLDHVLETLAGVDQPEGRDQGPAGHPELLLHPDPAVRLDRGHAVRDDGDRPADAVARRQQADRGFGHDDRPATQSHHRPDGFTHRGRRLGRHAVEGGDDRFGQRLQEGPEVIRVDAVGPGAVEPELVLDVDHVDVRGVDAGRGRPVALDVPLLDAPAHLAAVGTHLVRLVDGGDAGGDPGIRRLDRGHQVVGEGGDSAATGKMG